MVLGSPEDRDVPPGVELLLDDVTDPLLPPAARSDCWRWHVLRSGGFYADTDVIFLRNVEALFRGNRDAYITQDIGTPISRQRGGYRADGSRSTVPSISIGVLGAREGSIFFQRVHHHARRQPPGTDYQSHGTLLLVQRWAEFTRNLMIYNIPGSAFYRQGSSARHVRKLWTETGEFDPTEYGLHWYGGSPESAPYLDVPSAESLPECWVKRAVSR